MTKLTQSFLKNLHIVSLAFDQTSKAQQLENLLKKLKTLKSAETFGNAIVGGEVLELDAFDNKLFPGKHLVSSSSMCTEFHNIVWARFRSQNNEYPLTDKKFCKDLGNNEFELDQSFTDDMVKFLGAYIDGDSFPGYVDNLDSTKMYPTESKIREFMNDYKVLEENSKSLSEKNIHNLETCPENYNTIWALFPTAANKFESWPEMCTDNKFSEAFLNDMRRDLVSNVEFELNSRNSSAGMQELFYGNQMLINESVKTVQMAITGTMTEEEKKAELEKFKADVAEWKSGVEGDIDAKVREFNLARDDFETTFWENQSVRNSMIIQKLDDFETRSQYNFTEVDVEAIKLQLKSNLETAKTGILSNTTTILAKFQVFKSDLQKNVTEKLTTKTNALIKNSVEIFMQPFTTALTVSNIIKTKLLSKQILPSNAGDDQQQFIENFKPMNLSVFKDSLLVNIDFEGIKAGNVTCDNVINAVTYSSICEDGEVNRDYIESEIEGLAIYLKNRAVDVWESRENGNSTEAGSGSDADAEVNYTEYSNSLDLSKIINFKLPEVATEKLSIFDIEKFKNATLMNLKYEDFLNGEIQCHNIVNSWTNSSICDNMLVDRESLMMIFEGYSFADIFARSKILNVLENGSGSDNEISENAVSSDSLTFISEMPEFSNIVTDYPTIFDLENFKNATISNLKINEVLSGQVQCHNVINSFTNITLCEHEKINLDDINEELVSFVNDDRVLSKTAKFEDIIKNIDTTSMNYALVAMDKSVKLVDLVRNMVNEETQKTGSWLWRQEAEKRLYHLQNVKRQLTTAEIEELIELGTDLQQENQPTSAEEFASFSYEFLSTIDESVKNTFNFDVFNQVLVKNLGIEKFLDGEIKCSNLINKYTKLPICDSENIDNESMIDLLNQKIITSTNGTVTDLFTTNGLNLRYVNQKISEVFPVPLNMAPVLCPAEDKFCGLNVEKPVIVVIDGDKALKGQFVTNIEAMDPENFELSYQTISSVKIVGKIEHGFLVESENADLFKMNCEGTRNKREIFDNSKKCNSLVLARDAEGWSDVGNYKINVEVSDFLGNFTVAEVNVFVNAKAEDTSVFSMQEIIDRWEFKEPMSRCPCARFETCNVDTSDLTWQCECGDLFSGDLCQECAFGRYGDQCEFVDECITSNPCKNNAECLSVEQKSAYDYNYDDEVYALISGELSTKPTYVEFVKQALKSFENRTIKNQKTTSILRILSVHFFLPRLDRCFRTYL